MHINNNNLTDFENSTMDTDSMITFLEHLDQCDYCLEQLLEYQESEIQTKSIKQNSSPSSQVPAYMKESILNRASSMQIHTEKRALETTHQMRLFYEGLRTAVGVALALIMLFSLGQADLFSQTPRQPEPRATTAAARREARDSLHDLSSGITDGLSEGSQKIIEYMNSFPNTTKQK